MLVRPRSAGAQGEAPPGQRRQPWQPVPDPAVQQLPTAEPVQQPCGLQLRPSSDADAAHPDLHAALLGPELPGRLGAADEHAAAADVYGSAEHDARSGRAPEHVATTVERHATKPILLGAGGIPSHFDQGQKPTHGPGARSAGNQRLYQALWLAEPATAAVEARKRTAVG